MNNDSTTGYIDESALLWLFYLVNPKHEMDFTLEGEAQS